ncbi:MAG: hypothetical protein AAB221_16065 [Bacteroidota bacterium]
MRYIFIICLCLYLPAVHAQDITGTWEEHSETRFTSYTKLCIVNICGKYVGYTFDKDNEGGYCTTDFSGIFNKKKKQLRGEGVSFINKTTGHYLVIYNLYYRSVRGEEYLEGLVYEKPDTANEFSARLRDSTEKITGGPEFLQLVRTSSNVDSTAYMRLLSMKPCDTIAVVKKPAPVVIDTPVLVVVSAVQEKQIDPPVADTPVIISPQEAILQMRATRVNDTLFDIPATEKELFIKVLDNAITDGDTISIIHNGKLIAERIQVAARAFPIKIQLSKEHPYHELVLVAHNLGSIPPNTALLLVTSGGREYRLNAFADLTKNAVIIFRYIGQ